MQAPAFKLVSGGKTLEQGADVYELKDQLGKGNFGTVFEETREGTICAVKVCNQQGAWEQTREDAFLEVYALGRRRNNEHIVLLYDVYAKQEKCTWFSSALEWISPRS